MREQLLKLSPHRDLQCYFLTPSAIACMSGASDTAFTVSGKWREQFDWCVVEWNRDNVFEHPILRPLPDGDLSGLLLTYEEERSGCIPFESDLIPIVDWNDLRIWAVNDSGVESLYHVNLWPNCATPIAGSYVPASATMNLIASPGEGNRVGVAFLEAHYHYVVRPQDSLADIARGVAAQVNTSADFMAQSNGSSITITWRAGLNWAKLGGANGNRMSVYGFAQNGASCWANSMVPFAGGQFPSRYKVTVDFAALQTAGIPTDKVRKLRWTWAADLQTGGFEQSEFQVNVTNWTVTGNNRVYDVAGPGSRRVEDDDNSVVYTGTWQRQSGNFSGSTIHLSTTLGNSCAITYAESASHDLYLGTRLTAGGAKIAVQIDGVSSAPITSGLGGEDALIRSKVCTLPAGQHTITFTHAGPDGGLFFFDYLEIVYPSKELPAFEIQSQLALATDWDTYHSQSLPAERTAWLINTLGFGGRVNHYTGALWFSELVRPGMQYASSTLTLSNPVNNGSARAVLAIAPSPQLAASSTLISHLVLPDDTAANVAEALAGLVNLGTNLVWATAVGNQLVITARAMGTIGNNILVYLDPSSTGITASSSGDVLTGGVDGTPYELNQSDPLSATLTATAAFWRTDLAATPRLNRAARDWHRAYFAALASYGIECVASFSTELLNVDPSASAGMAQRYPDGTPVVLNTPSIQTNFSPTALAFWQQVYLDMAELQHLSGTTPYLQAGEVQWWYFANPSGMPFYDAYTTGQFQKRYNTPMAVVPNNGANPANYPNECAFLPTLIGIYTAAIRSALQSQFPAARFEVLYPTDTNDTPLNQIVNFPESDWTPANLTCLKTESFTFTGNYDLDKSTYSMSVSADKGFPASARSHLIGIGDASTAWMKEADIAQSQGLESVVLFALDQFCLIGYPAPPFVGTRRMQRQG